MLRILANAKPELARRYGIVRLALFGPSVRDEARLGGDVDVVISFDERRRRRRTFVCSPIWKAHRAMLTHEVVPQGALIGAPRKANMRGREMMATCCAGARSRGCDAAADIGGGNGINQE